MSVLQHGVLCCNSRPIGLYAEPLTGGPTVRARSLTHGWLALQLRFERHVRELVGFVIFLLAFVLLKMQRFEISKTVHGCSSRVRLFARSFVRSFIHSFTRSLARLVVYAPLG